MGAERVDYYSEDDYQYALQAESEPEPDVVPCFRCGGQMYQECHAPEGNRCSDCRKGESKMDRCCVNETTPHCPTCGSDLKGKTLAGLKDYLGTRLATAKNRLRDWLTESGNPKGSDDATKKAIVRNTNAVVQFESWIAKLDEVIG